MFKPKIKPKIKFELHSYEIGVCQSLATKSESVNDYCIAAGESFTVTNTADSWIASKKLVVSTTVRNILSFIKAELRNLRYKIAGWKFHSSSGKRKCRFSCSISFLVAQDTDMTWYPAHNKNETTLVSVQVKEVAS